VSVAAYLRAVREFAHENPPTVNMTVIVLKVNPLASSRRR